MARENMVYLTGIVSSEVILNDNLNEAGFLLTTMRYSYLNDEMEFDGRKRIDEIQVICRSPKVIREQILDEQTSDGDVQTQIKTGDGVMIKGTLVTLDIPKEAYCPNCGQLITKKMAVSVYVELSDVTKIKKKEELLDDKSKTDFFNELAPFGNHLHAIGTIVRDPILYDEYGHVPCATFQLAIPSFHKSTENSEKKKADFPWVKTYGRKMCKEVMTALHKDSQIYINGAIQQRTVESAWTCGTCRIRFPYKDWAIEIVPYSLEYLKNCETNLLIQEEPEVEELLEYKERGQNEVLKDREFA